MLMWKDGQTSETKNRKQQQQQKASPRSWGGPRGPNLQGKAKPNGQVYAL